MDVGLWLHSQISRNLPMRPSDQTREWETEQSTCMSGRSWNKWNPAEHRLSSCPSSCLSSCMSSNWGTTQECVLEAIRSVRPGAGRKRIRGGLGIVVMMSGCKDGEGFD